MDMSCHIMTAMREKSKRRRHLLLQQFRVNSEEELSIILGNNSCPQRRRRTNETNSKTNDSKEIKSDHSTTNNLLPPPSHPAYRDPSSSFTFLKGTQSANPHNDYCQHFVDTGQRPQNFIRDVGLTDRFEEYPKLKELIRLKDGLIQQTACPPMYLRVDLRDSSSFNLRTDLGKGKFDVILIEPPLEEYQKVMPVLSHHTSSHSSTQPFWSWQEIQSLPIEDIAAQRSFIFLWVGSGDGLDLGRHCLKKWGFRRCEDICWIKTNIESSRSSFPIKHSIDPSSLCHRSKEHCLMGIKGTVRRSTDGDFIHANVDIDLIITEEPPLGHVDKPSEIFNIIEHFCLGRRRLHIFGRDSTIRPGWLTIGPELTHSNFNPDVYWKTFEGPNGHLTGCTERIESLRPKSPPPKNKNPTSMPMPIVNPGGLPLHSPTPLLPPPLRSGMLPIRACPPIPPIGMGGGGIIHRPPHHPINFHPVMRQSPPVRMQIGKN